MNLPYADAYIIVFTDTVTQNAEVSQKIESAEAVFKPAPGESKAVLRSDTGLSSAQVPSENCTLALCLGS